VLSEPLLARLDIFSRIEERWLAYAPPSREIAAVDGLIHGVRLLETRLFGPKSPI
jgi:hypothetical protein